MISGDEYEEKKDDINNYLSYSGVSHWPAYAVPSVLDAYEFL